MSLTPPERQALTVAAGLLIPADPALGMPAADDPSILADIEKSIGRDLALVRQALASLDPAKEVNTWMAEGGLATRALGRIVLGAYYRDDRVLTALGHEARAPFPKGYEVEQGDWALVDTVKARPAFWRDDRKTPPHSDGEVASSYDAGGVTHRESSPDHDPSAREDAGTSPADGGGR